MKIHEYQAKELFSRYGVPVPRGGVAFSAEEALKVSAELGTYPVVLKAQIHAGGRGKGGGVKVARSEEDVRKLADQMIGMTLITHQTGPEGRVVKKILVEEALPIKSELYLGMLPDRKSGKIVIMASSAGGMDIEEVAARYPEKITSVYVDPLLGLQPFHTRQLAYGLGLSGELVRGFSSLVTNLYRLFVDYDCSLVEVNPLIISEDDKLVALDAKVNFDDNGLFRHRDVLNYRDPDEEDPLELEASKYNLNYIKMNGTIGNMVNGAGLAMATMDLIKLAGAEPANFLDVGGGASAEMVENGFRIILSDPNVRGVFVNIFGGILRCDVLAQGIVEAARKVDIRVPVVIRMEGTNVEKGREILEQSGLKFLVAKDLKDAIDKIAGIARQQG